MILGVVWIMCGNELTLRIDTSAMTDDTDDATPKAKKMVPTTAGNYELFDEFVDAVVVVNAVSKLIVYVNKSFESKKKIIICDTYH